MHGDTGNAVEEIVCIPAAVVILLHIRLNEAVVPKSGHYGFLRKSARCPLNIDGSAVVCVHNGVTGIGPADAEAAQSHAFGNGADSNGARPHAGHAADADHFIFGENSVFKSLVAHADQIMSHAEGRKLLKLFACIGDACGIVGVCEKNHFRAAGNTFFILFNADMVSIFRIGGDSYGNAAEKLGIEKIARIARIMDQDLIAGIDPGHHGKNQAVVRTGVDDDVSVRIQCKAVFALNAFCDQCFELRIADGHCIVRRKTALQLFNSGVEHTLRDRRVWHKGIGPTHECNTGSLHSGGYVADVSLLRRGKKAAVKRGKSRFHLVFDVVHLCPPGRVVIRWYKNPVSAGRSFSAPPL